MGIEIKRGNVAKASRPHGRADRVTLRMRSYHRTHPIPHDLVHLALERRVVLGGRLWSSLSSGVVFDSVEIVSGSSTPRAAASGHRDHRAHRPHKLARAQSRSRALRGITPANRHKRAPLIA